MNGSLFTPGGLWRALTPADRIVTAGVLVAAFGLSLVARVPHHGATHALVTVGGDEVADIHLDVSGITRVTGRRGPVSLEVSGGAIRVSESTCPHRVCMAMGFKHRRGEVLVCAPNAMLVRLMGGRADPDVPDAVSR